MSKTCARCEKTVYPIEELKCLDKVRKERPDHLCPVGKENWRVPAAPSPRAPRKAASRRNFESLSNSDLRKECRSPRRSGRDVPFPFGPIE